MGSMIHLSVGRLEIDWGKNSGFTDHSGLFQATDVTDVPYYYAGSDYVDGAGEKQWKIRVEKMEGLSKKLSEVKERIELLGYTLNTCQIELNPSTMHSPRDGHLPTIGRGGRLRRAATITYVYDTTFGIKPDSANNRGKIDATSIFHVASYANYSFIFNGIL